MPVTPSQDNKQEKQIIVLETNGTLVHQHIMRKRRRRRRGENIQGGIDHGIILLFGGTAGLVSLFGQTECERMQRFAKGEKY